MLVEAVVGIGLLAVVATAVGGVHRSVSSTEARTTAQVHAVGHARATLALTRGGDAVAGTPGTTGASPGVEVEVESRPAATLLAGACAPSLATEPDVIVEALPTRHAHARAVRLPGVLPEPSSTPGSIDVRVELAPGTAERVSGGVVRSGDGTEHGLVADGETCWRATLEVGIHEVELVPRTGTVLVGPTHLLHGSAVPTWTVTRPTTLRLTHLAPAASVRVDVDTGGARTPDEVDPGALRWMVRGDDARLATALGHERLLHPGPVTVVVSACEHPEAQGSTSRVVTTPDGASEVLVPLGTLQVRGIEGRNGASLVAIRTTGCADGSGLRPALTWNGGLAEGMRVALPHGAWELRLETPEGSRLTATVTALVDGSEPAVDLP